MLHVSATSRQPAREAWTMDRLINERSIALGYSLDTSSFGAYTSALNSYLTFCNLHHLPVDPTPDTLSFFVVFLSSHIAPKSVNSYLSGICRQLEPFFPEVRQNRKSLLVSRTVAGCLRRFGTPTQRKAPFSHADLQRVLDSLPSTPSHDDLLFSAILLTGFHALMRLGELVFPDKRVLRNYRKISLRHSVQVSIVPPQFSFFLPSHKGDRTFEGNTIVVQRVHRPTDPFPASSPTSLPVTACSLSIQNSGSHPVVLYQLDTGSSHACVSFFPARIMPVTHSDRAVRPPLPRLGSTLLLFRLLDAGPLPPSRFTFAKIPWCYMPHSSGVLLINRSISLLFSFSSFTFHRCALLFSFPLFFFYQPTKIF